MIKILLSYTVNSYNYLIGLNGLRGTNKVVVITDINTGLFITQSVFLLCLLDICKQM